MANVPDRSRGNPSIVAAATVATIMVAIGWCSDTRAQPRDEATPNTGQRTTYFLIDASGSMRGSDAEDKVSAILDPIRASDPDALVSRTYFRARDGAACWAPIEIVAPVSASQSAPRVQEYRSDYTPLGEALRSALRAAIAKGGPADIYVISDQDQTPGCGIDVCAVATAFLPVPNVRVRAIPVTSSGAAPIDRLGCIDAAQTRQAPPSTLQSESGAASEDWSFAERWLWLLNFLVVGLSALWLGFRDSEAAVRLENETSDARSLRDLIERGDSTAKLKLDRLANKQETEKTSTALKDPAFWLFTTGILCLLTFTLMPDSGTILGLRLSVAKAAAWSVLNSNFATAFAVTWVALLFFWGSQSQRRREARHRLQIATNEGERVAQLRQEQENKVAYKAYEEAYESVASQAFDPPWPKGQSSDDDLEAFRRVEAMAISIALGEKRTPTDSTATLISEVERLKKFAPPLLRFFTTWSFPIFVARLRDSELLPAHAAANWSAVADGEPSEKLEAIRVLATPG